MVRKSFALLTVLLSALIVTGCTSQPATNHPVVKHPLPATVYTLDRQPFAYTAKDTPRLKFGTDDGYNNTSYDGTPSTLDSLIGAPKSTRPIVVDYAALSPALRSFKDVTQRAILFTNEMIKQGRPINLLPSKLITSPKPTTASPTSEAIDNKAGYVDDTTFSALYIELKDGVRQTILVSGYGYDSSATPKNRFYVDHGLSTIKQPYISAIPGKKGVNTLFWQASVLKADCSRERNERNRYSSGCALIMAGDNQHYDGHSNVILVAPVSTFEYLDFYQNAGKPVESYATLSFQLKTRGGGLVTTLSPSGLPFMTSKLDGTITSDIAQWFAEGGTLVGGSDILAWPAYVAS